MEFAIAIFVGVWICLAGLLAYGRIHKDFKEAEAEIKNEEENKS